MVSFSVTAISVAAIVAVVSAIWVVKESMVSSQTAWLVELV
jgi:hypothetical protein